MKINLTIIFLLLNINILSGQDVVKPFIMLLDDKLIFSAKAFSIASNQKIKTMVIYDPGKLTFKKSCYDSIVGYSDSLNLKIDLCGFNNVFNTSDKIMIKLKVSNLDNRYFLLYIYSRAGKLRKKEFRGNNHKYYYEQHNPNLYGWGWCDPL